MRFLQNLWHTRPSFSNFSVNNGDGMLIFGMDVENRCVLENKREKNPPKYQTRPGGPKEKIGMTNIRCVRKTKFINDA